MEELHGLKYVRFSEVEDKFLTYFKNKNLIPIIGAGFSKGSQAVMGIVPDRENCIKDMLRYIKETDKELAEELKEAPFQEIATVFMGNVSKNNQRKYIKDCYTQVKLDEYKKLFLDIDWWYIYTLNIDDAIENNSKYKEIININKKFVLKNNIKHVRKLHGDANSFTKYDDDDSRIIFSQEEYIQSINKNKFLLNALKTDYESNNLLFVGCSLKDEFDILSIVDKINSQTDIMIVQKEKYNRRESETIKKYKINTVILVDDYDEFYQDIYRVWQNSTVICSSEWLKPLKYEDIDILEPRYDIDKEYLFYGGEIQKNQKLVFPSFFIDREIDKVSEMLKSHNVIVLYGGICSGKTYYIYGLAKKISNRDVYIVSSKTRINDDVLKEILDKRNILLLIDTNVLTSNQMSYIIEHRNKLHDKDNCIVMALHRNDQTFDDKLSMMEEQEKDSFTKKFTIHPKLNNDESREFKNKLYRIEITGFDPDETLINNIIDMSERNNIGNKFQDIKPQFYTNSQIAAMIILAIDKKIYLANAINFDIKDDLECAVKISQGLISVEKTKLLEKNALDTSAIKYVLYADFWLLKNMREFAKSLPNHTKIIEAYEYIIDKILIIYGEPDIKYSNNKIYREYIKFDNINKIFNWNKNDNANINLICKIYEKLTPKLYLEPNFMHQMAKCYIRCAYCNEDIKEKEDFLNKAFRTVNVAISTFAERYKESQNDKVKISHDHALYTLGVIMTNIAKVKKYDDLKVNEKAIDALYNAFISSNNSYQYLKNDKELDKGNAVMDLINIFWKKMEMNADILESCINCMRKLRYLKGVMNPN